ncbi:MAG: hypothetical protein ISS77_03970 [Phycisphaerae bacterium]|nr:hypothetical protein [Phycisphaerae bacterium]
MSGFLYAEDKSIEDWLKFIFGGLIIIAIVTYIIRDRLKMIKKELEEEKEKQKDKK